MTNHPYAESSKLADLLWEAEMVADEYSQGGLILVRTSDGWRAFLGSFGDQASMEIERSLDENVPSYEKAFRTLPRSPTLIDEIQRLLPDCTCFESYRPMKFVDESGD